MLLRPTEPGAELVRVLAGSDRVGVNIQLTVGELNQTVEVSAAAPLLQTESTTLGNTMGSKQVSELPLGGQRKFTFLAPLEPGDKTNFGPRIGVAYQMLTKTVIRAGYGLFYGGEENQGGNPNRGEGIPFNQTMDLLQNSAFEASHPYLGRFSQGWPTNIFTLPANIQFRGVDLNFRDPLVAKWNATVQQDLGWSSALEVSYIGSKGSRQLINWDPNVPRNSPIPNADANSRPLYPFLRGGIQQTTSTFGRSNSHGLAAKFEKRYSSGLTMTSSYTWGHALADTGTTLSGSAGFGLYDNACGFRCEYSTAAWDIRHRWVTSFNRDLPFGRGRSLGADLHPVANAIVGGWQTNGILTLSTGQPFTFRSQNCVGSFSACRPDAVSGKTPMDAPSGGRTPDQWFDVTAVQAPTPGTGGNIGPQTGVGPGIRNLDFSMFKTFEFSERYRLQFRSEWLNLSNTLRFAVSSIGNTQGTGNFGRLSAMLPGTARNVQFALRFKFQN